MKKLISVVLVGLLIVGTSPVFAFKKGINELSPTFKLINADDADTLSLGIDYGYYFTPNHEGKVLLDYTKTDIAGFGKTTGGYFGLGYEYNFIDVSMNHLPFLGGGLNFPLSDFSDIYDRVIFIQGGFKTFFVPKKVAVRSSLSIERYSGEGAVGDTTALAIRVGLVIFFTPAQFQKKMSKAGAKKVSKKTSKKKTRIKRKQKGR